MKKLVTLLSCLFFTLSLFTSVQAKDDDAEHTGIPDLSPFVFIKRRVGIIGVKSCIQNIFQTLNVQFTLDPLI